MIDFSRGAPKMVSADEAKREESAKLTSEQLPRLRFSGQYSTRRVNDRLYSTRRLALQPKLDRNFTLSSPMASLTIDRRSIFGIREITRSFRRFSVKCPRDRDLARRHSGGEGDVGF